MNEHELTSAHRAGQGVSYGDLQKRERELWNRRLKAAVARAADGKADWELLTYGMGRNELPDLLQFVWNRLNPDQLIIAVGDSWSSCEFPEQRMLRRDWLPIFRAAGYHDGKQPAEPPRAVTLWRDGGEENPHGVDLRP